MTGMKCDFEKVVSEDFFLIPDSAFSRRNTNQNCQSEVQQEEQAEMTNREWMQAHSWCLV